MLGKAGCFLRRAFLTTRSDDGFTRIANVLDQRDATMSFDNWVLPL